MGLGEGIRKVGFRKWYERELLTGHAHLVLLLMCVLGLMTALEASTRFLSAADQAIDFVSVIVCAGVGLWALRRYMALLARAQAIAHQADCPACQAYGRLDCTGEREDEVHVRCRSCGHRWTIHL
ncbi:MAG: hypothetical protein RI988_428 [Pseudomonadota bacterium]|jgi:ABC-type nickel/cobalt efflux system permease component RcnA